MQSTPTLPDRREERSELFFVLSGEHSSLPSAEVRAILDAEAVQHSMMTEEYRLLKLTAAARALSVVSQRSLMYDSCGFLLGECASDQAEFEKLVRSQPLESITQAANSFAVRSMRLGGVARSINRVNVEGEVGGIVKESVPRLKVNLNAPDLIFVCILHGSRFMFGISAFQKAPGLVFPRLPRKRPAFHPSTMPPKIARCMVNLSRAKRGATLLDPFCGVGGILIEGAVIGCNVVGLDANRRMLRGARSNLKHFKLNALGLVNSDARASPIWGVDAIATDPPYGRGSSTMGVKMTELIRDFLARAANTLGRDKYLCLSVPKQVDVARYASDGGFTIFDQHLVRVHRSLTRRLAVLRIGGRA